MYRIMLALGLFMLGCGEVTVAEVDAMTCPEQPVPVQCDQCEALCPETGWGIAYVDLFEVVSSGRWEYGGFATFVNTGSVTLQIATPTITSVRAWNTELDLLVQVGTEPEMIWLEPGAAHGALDTEAEQLLTETRIINGPVAEGSRPWLTWNVTGGDWPTSAAATNLIKLEVPGLPGHVMAPLTVYSRYKGSHQEPSVRAHSARFVCAQADE